MPKTSLFFKHSQKFEECVPRLTAVPPTTGLEKCGLYDIIHSFKASFFKLPKPKGVTQAY